MEIRNAKKNPLQSQLTILLRRQNLKEKKEK